MNKLDLTGRIFGNWIVQREVEKVKDKRYWEVMCRCGNIKAVRQSSLTSGDTTSCGKGTCNSRSKDLTGEVFGKLTVISSLGMRKDRTWQLCKCECGNIKEASSTHLLTGSIVTCGKCQLTKFYKADNFFIGVTNKGDKFYFDAIDYEKIVNRNWWATNNYLVTKIKGVKTLIHRLILNPSKDQVIDHINGNPLDNRRCNIRICTQAQNTYNSSIRIDSGNGFKGIYSKGKKYGARIQHKGIRYHLGVYETKELAKSVYDKKARELFGEFARK